MKSEKVAPAKGMKKPPKPASMFRRPIAEASFRKKCLGLLEQGADRAFLEASFTLSGGSYSLKEGLDRDSLLRLNKLAKAIAANRGLVKKGPLLLAALLAAGLAAFGLFFMNSLLEGAAERGLEAVFGARAEISSLRLDPFRLRLSLGGIAVADRDAPMTNLFETGGVELRLSLASALRGRVYIEEARTASIALGGARSSSGALPDEPARPRAKKAEKAASGEPLLDLSRFDAAALLEREKAKLSSAAAYEKAAAAYAEAAKRWKDRASASRKGVAELLASSKRVMAIDPKSVKTASEALKAAAEAKSLLDASASATREAAEVASGIRSDAAEAAALEKAARAAVDGDFAYLKSFIDPRSGAATGVLEPLIRDLLSDKGDLYLYYGERALEAGLALSRTAGGGKAAGKPKSGGLGRGRDVAYPSAALPRFRLGHLGVEFRSGSAAWKADLRELSSEPSLVGAPTSLDLAMEGGAAGGAPSARAKAILDLRGAEPAYSVDAEARGLGLDLGDALARAGIGRLSGEATGRLGLRGEAEGAVEASGSLAMRDVVARGAEGALGESIASALAAARTVQLDASYRRPRGGEGRLSIRTNLDSLVAKAAGALAARYAGKAAADLEAALRGYAGTELEGALGSKAELGSLSSAAAGDERSAAALGKGLDGKSKELEARARQLGSKALKGIDLPKLKP